MHQSRFRFGAPPQTSLGELTALPRFPSWILGTMLLQKKVKQREKKEKQRGDGEREEKEREKETRSPS